jgi:hypothetical protein
MPVTRPPCRRAAVGRVLIPWLSRGGAQRSRRVLGIRLRSPNRPRSLSLRDTRMRVRGPAGVREDVIFRHPPGRLSGSSTFRAAGTLGRCRALPLRGRANSRAMGKQFSLEKIAMGAGRPRLARRLVEIECRIAALHSRLMWVLADVVGLFSIKVVPFSPNLGRDHRIFSANLGPKRRMLLGQAVYVLGPLQIAGCPVKSDLG